MDDITGRIRRRKRFFENAFAKRPEEELFDIDYDPGCMHNLVGDPEFAEVKERLRTQLHVYLRETDDPREVGPNPDIFESYKRYAGMRRYPKPDWAAEMKTDELEQLLATVHAHNEPVVRPREIGDWGLSMGRWKLVRSQEDDWLLYNIRKDSEQKHDLSRQKYRIVDNLERVYEYWNSGEQRN